MKKQNISTKKYNKHYQNQKKEIMTQMEKPKSFKEICPFFIFVYSLSLR